MNVAGHLLSTAQIESALVEHDAVTEAAVVSCPHKEKGEKKTNIRGQLCLRLYKSISHKVMV